MKKLARTRLIEERKQHQWSQQELADRLGTTQRNISRWELGLTTPGPYFRAKLCALFGKNAEDLELTKKDLLPTIVEEKASILEEAHSSRVEELALWTVPYQRNPHFTGRDEVLEQLAQHLVPQKTGDRTTTCRAALTQPQAIKGLGGIGKTQITVEYAFRAREQGRYTHFLWINAASEEAILTSFIALAKLLPGFSIKEEKDQQKLVASMKRWLEQCQQHWLLIFDNADNLSLIQEYLPRQGNGSILMTTRANAVAAIATPIEVEPMGLIEGTRFLLHRAQRLRASDEESNEAANVVIALDGFPLALDQAGAYIEETGCSFEEYLQLYQNHRKDLLARRGTQATNYPDSVATTWSLSFQKVEQANPAAAELLRLCAFLAPDRIPEELLREGSPYWSPLLQQATTDLFTFNQVLEELLKFSFVKRLADNHMLSIHRLVQVVQRDTIELEEQHCWAQRVVRAVNAMFPLKPKEEVATWPRCLRYLAQAQVCDALIQQHQLLLPEAAELLDRVSIYLRERASYGIAEPLCLRAIQIWEWLLGPEHLQVACSLNHLGNIYYKQGRYTEAEPLFQRALQIREHQLGHEHLEVAQSLHNLAILYKDQGKYARAEDLFLQALHIEELLLDAEDLQFPPLLNNLAVLFSRQGKYTEAEDLFQRALHIRERHLGSEHLDLTYSLNGLANLLFRQERYAEAEPLYQRVLHIREQQLGPHHPFVAIPLHNLADLFLAQRRYTEAEAFYRRSLRIWEQQLGSQHEKVAHSLVGLANLHRTQGNYTEAALLYQRALCIREQVLDPYHPDTAEALHDFAILRGAQGNFQEAVSLYQRALAIREHTLGHRHPKTIETHEHLHAALVAQGRVEEAVQLGVQTTIGS